MPDVEQRKILTDHHHHRVDRLVFHDRQPFFLGHGAQLDAIFIRQRLANGNEIVTGVETGRNGADIFAKRLAVTQEHRTGQHIDLRAGIVDVIFLGNAVTRKSEQVRQRVADNGATAMADMHRAGRIGGDIFDVDLLACTDGGAAEIDALTDHIGQKTLPVTDRNLEIDEARTRDIDAVDIAIRLKCGHDEFGKRARIGAERLRQHHGGIGCDIAVAQITRGFDRNSTEIDLFAVLFHEIEGLERVFDPGIEISKNVHRSNLREGLLFMSGHHNRVGSAIARCPISNRGCGQTDAGGRAVHNCRSSRPDSRPHAGLLRPRSCRKCCPPSSGSAFPPAFPYNGGKDR
ncbi:hypothetical protein D3C86_1173350 [compost metagenome]